MEALASTSPAAAAAATPAATAAPSWLLQNILVWCPNDWQKRSPAGGSAHRLVEALGEESIHLGAAVLRGREAAGQAERDFVPELLVTHAGAGVAIHHKVL